MRSGSRLAAALALAALAACVDPLDLPVEGEPDRLVVVGLVTEGPGPHEVALRFAAAFERGVDAIERSVTGARVTIAPVGGAPVALTEGQAGRYRTAPGALVGAVGETYTLRAELPDGRVFTATAGPMPAAPPITDVTTVLHRDPNGPAATSRAVIDLLVDTADPAGEANFYRWTWEGEYEAEVCRTQTECELCYFSRRGRTLTRVADDRLADGQPLRSQLAERFDYVADARPFVRAFYLRAEQQALPADAYAFWAQARDVRALTGGLFDPPPDPIVGNVASATDPADAALGHFTVAGVAHAATCARLSDYPDRPPVSFEVLGGTCASVGAASAPSPAFVAACGR